MFKQFPQLTFRSQQLLFGFGIFRLILATGLSVLAFLPDTARDLLPTYNQESLQLATIAYLILAIIGMLVTVNEQPSKTSITVLLITDILLIMMIMRYAGGVDSGFGSLLLIGVGVGGLLLPIKLSLLVAAIATSSVIYTEMLPIASDASRDLFQSGLLGVGYFAETLFLQYVGQRVTSTEKLAQAQADTILDLRHLNELIVQRMRTGIIVITSEGAIRLLNDSARYLLNIEERQPFWLSEPVFERLKRWQSNPLSNNEAFQADADHPQISVNFAKLQNSKNSDIIVFLEDTGRMNQQAQQLKLASLGRLTASIAHEIRNPLGAISHATQLLEESPNIDKSDARLLSIIHNHSDRVNNIIETILELSRRRPSKLEKIQLSLLVQQCISEREVHISKLNEHIHFDPILDCVVELDANQIKQVLHNLIENGLRYSEKNTGKRTVKLTPGRLVDTAQYYLDVEDDGAGVPEDHIINLFEPFFTTENSGTGLGLYIAKELCEANRLQLTYADNKVGGCFRIIFSHAISHTTNKDT